MTETQSVVSETSRADGRLEQQAAVSVAGQGQSLNILQPQTLPSYPVYKFTDIRLRCSSVEDKWRPLSYHWLIRHCAKHIHVKPSIVERFVERLELLHVIPSNTYDKKQQVTYNGLIRRCFQRIANKRYRRRYGKLAATAPARKLI